MKQNHETLVELLVTAECPREQPTSALLRTTLDELGLRHVRVHTTVITCPAEATRRGFTGSPTILIKGRDPWHQPDQPPALACRLYPTETGLPNRHHLAAAIHAAIVHGGGPGSRLTEVLW